MKIRLLVISILFLSLMVSCGQNAPTIAATTPTTSPTSAPTAIPTATQDPIKKAQFDAQLYNQDFESSTTDGLDTFGQGQWKVMTDTSGNHFYCNQDSTDWWDVHFGTDLWTNYAVEMRVKILTVDEFSFISSHIRVNIFNNGYAGSLNYAGQSAGLSYNPPHQSLGESPFPIKADTWYVLRMEAAGNRVKLFADNRLMADVTDSKRTQGEAGFSVSPHTQMCVDDIRAWALTPNGQIAQLPAKPAPRTLLDRLASHKFPKLYYSNQDFNHLTNINTPLYFWDIVTFDKQVAKSQWGLLGPSGMIRSQNPNAVILAVQSIQEFFPNDTSETNLDFLSGLKPDWVMQDINGKPFPVFYYSDNGTTFWSSMINLSTDINTYIPQYLNQEVMRAGLFDGVFYDGASETWWQAGRSAQDTPRGSGPIDSNRDGKPDTTTELNTAQDAGMQKLLNETRKVFPNDSIITGNGGWDGGLLLDKNATTDTVLANLLNGREIEGFLNWEKYGIGWLKSMRAYYLMQQASLEPKTPLLSAYCTGSDYDHLRYVLSSALMFNAYFSCTNAQTGGALQTGAISVPYTANWWYDEYSVDLSTGKAVQSLDAKGYLGLPITDAYNVDDKNILLSTLLTNNDPKAGQLTWRRDFQNGIVLVNPFSVSKTIELNGTYRKILGVHDPKFNDGSTITKVTLPPQSGIILLKP